MAIQARMRSQTGGIKYETATCYTPLLLFSGDFITYSYYKIMRIILLISLEITRENIEQIFAYPRNRTRLLFSIIGCILPLSHSRYIMIMKKACNKVSYKQHKSTTTFALSSITLLFSWKGINCKVVSLLVNDRRISDKFIHLFKYSLFHAIFLNTDRLNSETFCDIFLAFIWWVKLTF